MKKIIAHIVNKEDPYKDLKLGIWLYLFLLIFEGSLRKWVFPSFSTPLLIVRDPLAIWLLIKAISSGKLRPNYYWISFIAIGVLSFFTALVFGHASLPVALFGARALILHFPLMFVIGFTMDRNDVIKMGKFLLFLLIPMIFLTIVQFYSPQSAWVNRGVGGDLNGAGFGGALGYFRPPGTFSFTNGLTTFYGLCSCFAFYFVLNPKKISKWLLTASIIATILSVPFTISRTVLFQNVLCLLFLVIVLLKKGKLSKIIIYGTVSFFILLLLSFIPAVQTGLEVFQSRFDSASESEGGIRGTLIDRVFGTLIQAILDAPDQSLWGKGIGADTNVGLQVLGSREGQRIADFEWARIILEIGPLLGIAFIVTRSIMVMKMFLLSIKALMKSYSLPWMIFSLAGINVLQGQMAQPTQLGFLVVFGGLFLASLRKER